MKKILLVISYCFLLTGVFAQNKKINGHIVDSTGKSVQSATVTMTAKGFKKTIQTDKDGNFSATVPDQGKVTVVISSQGYKTLTTTTDGTTALNFSLQHEVAVLDEVVVNVGYGTLKKKELSSSVSSITAKDLKDVPINSAAEALNGRLAGVTATTAEGSPDAEVKVRVRGGMSITNDNSPLYIVDGVQVENGLSTISPQDIQSIDVLKDAAATAIYGARGANGVIVISTKSGKPGKLKLSYNGFIGVQFLANKLKLLNSEDFVEYQYERYKAGIDTSSFLANYATNWNEVLRYKSVPAIDWQQKVFGNTGIVQTHSISASGGNQKITYNLGYTFNNTKAIVINSNYTRHLFNLKSDYKITKKIKLSIGGRYANQTVLGAGVSDDKNSSSYSRLRNAVKYRPFLGPDQQIDEQDPTADVMNAGNGLNLVNPIVLANAEYRKKTTETFNGNASLTYNITKNITLKSTFGYESKQYVDRQFGDSITSYSINQYSAKPVVSLDTVATSTITNSNVISYSLKNFRKKHDFDVLFGEETYDYRTSIHNSFFWLYPLFTTPETAFSNTSLGSSFTGYPKPERQTRYTSLSFFGRVNYSFKKKYIFSFDMRADGASKFAPSNRWGIFPAGSVAWRVKGENFMQKIDFISDLKLRGGFGYVGNNRINDYLYLTTFNDDNGLYYGLNNQPVYALYPSSLPNPNLKWESTVNRNFGFDISLFKSRIDLSLDLYDNSSKDLLLNVPIASTYGYSSQYQNVGKTSNKGVELQLSLGLIKKPQFTWSASYNMSWNTNKVEAIGDNQTSFSPAASWGITGQPVDYIVRVGDPVGAMWGLLSDGFYGINDFDYNTTTQEYTLKNGVASNAKFLSTTVSPGSIKFKDINNDGVIDEKDRTIIGNPNPKYTGGLTQNFTYKNWDASIFVNFSYGNDVYNANKIEFTSGYTSNSNMLDIMFYRWRTITSNGELAQWESGGKSYGISPDQLFALNGNAKIWKPGTGATSFYPSSWAIEDGSFIRINNITIGYSLPVASLVKLHMSKLRFYVTASNLYVFTKYSGYDPEVSVRSNQLTPGLDYSAYPKNRSFIFGVNATF